MQRITRIIAFGYLAICLFALASRAFIGSPGYAPFPLVAGPARPPIVVTIWAGREKQDWLTDATNRFAATGATYGGRPIQIQLIGMGSQEMVQRVAQQNWSGVAPPTALSPASGFWLDTRIQLAEPARSLALSPLVVVGWQERASVLWPSGPRNFWNDLHDAIANPGGWAAVGGQPQWGLVKFGHTRPTSSNSGAQALMLMAYAYSSKNAGLSAADVASPGFQQWLQTFEGGATLFGDSTDAFMDDMVRFGPAKYDFGVVYEHLALQSMAAAQGKLQIFYPPATLLSDHPFAMLAGEWVKPEERAAAGQFRDFLLSRPMQELALSYGFRPADASVSIAAGDPNNPFTKYAQNGVQVALASPVEAPPSDVIAALLDMWRTQIGR
jgi:nitrate reductase NapE component